MSNLIYACWRAPGDAMPASHLGAVADHIRPAVLAPHPHHLGTGFQDCLCLTGPQGSATIMGSSGHVGIFAGAAPGWHQPGTSLPDGTYALVRSDAARVELCSDAVGSRTLWYAFTPSHLLVSTSQRALVRLLGGLDFNPQALAWFLSSGSLGPSAAWDRRISRLPGDARLVLDRAAWRVDLHQKAPEFHPERLPTGTCRHDLARIAREAVQRYDFASARWVLPLSGGYDCRFILDALAEGGLRPRAITWGLAASLHQPGNDAYVASRLAAHFGLEHEYLHTDLAREAPDRVVDAFLSASGGTTDQLFPYLDGLRLWSTLADQGVDGIIRGDEGFGWIPLRTETQARCSVSATLLTDFMDPAQAETVAQGQQHFPDDLRRHPGETIPAYRDRLYHAYRIPVGLASLNDVKAPFVEIANPLLSRSILEFVRRMPDRLRTDKNLFKRIVQQALPGMPFASMAADDDGGDFLRTPAMRQLIQVELSGESGARLLPEGFRHQLITALFSPPAAQRSRSFRSFIKRVVPSAWISKVRSRMGPLLPSSRLLALRAFLACRTVRMLEADGAAGDPRT